MLTRDQFLQQAQVATRTVDIPGLGEVRIRRLSIQAQSEWAAQTVADEKRGDLSMARLLVAALVDEAGEPVFGPADVDLILKLDAKLITAAYKAVLEFNAMDAGALEQATKNS